MTILMAYFIITLFYFFSFILFAVITALLCNRYITSIKLGFFKKIFSFTVKEVEISIHLLPLFPSLRGKEPYIFIKESVSGIIGVIGIVVVGLFTYAFMNSFLLLPKKIPLCKVSHSEKLPLLWGDVIKSVDGVPVKFETDLFQLLQSSSQNDTILLGITRDSKNISMPVVAIALQDSATMLQDFGITLQNKVYLSKITPNSPAFLSGINVNDTLLMINHTNVTSSKQVLRMINHYGLEQTLVVTIKRGETLFDVQLIPEYNSINEKYIIGVQLNTSYPFSLQNRPDLLSSFTVSLKTLSNLYDLRDSKKRTTMSGPIGILLPKTAREEAISYTTLLCFSLWKKPISYVMPIIVIAMINAVVRRRKLKDVG